MTTEFLIRLSPAQRIAQAAYLRINDTLVDWFRDLGGCDNLPTAFDLGGEGWLEAERAIEEAAAAEDIEKTTALCQAYEKRALAYFEAWRKKLEKQNGASQ